MVLQLTYGQSIPLPNTMHTELPYIYNQISLAFNMFSTLVLVEVKLSGN